MVHFLKTLHTKPQHTHTHQAKHHTSCKSKHFIQNYINSSINTHTHTLSLSHVFCVFRSLSHTRMQKHTVNTVHTRLMNVSAGSE